MAATANIVYDRVCDQSLKWIADQIAKDIEPDKYGLVTAYNNKCYTIPAFKVNKTFIEAGYGPEKTTKWINLWKRMRMIDYTYLGTNEIRYFIMPIVLSDGDRNSILEIIDGIKKEESKKMKRINNSKEAIA